MKRHDISINLLGYDLITNGHQSLRLEILPQPYHWY